MLKVIGRGAARGAMALGVLLVLVTVLPVAAWGTRWLAADWPALEADTLIVLGGGVYSMMEQTAVPAESTHLRCAFTLWLWRQHRYQRVILSGSEAAVVMRDFLVAQGVPAEAIVVESESRTTRENALRVRDILRGLPAGGGRLLVVTSDYHSRRALGCFRRLGVSAQAVPAPDILKRSNRWLARWNCFLQWGDELVRWTYYGVRGWI